MLIEEANWLRTQFEKVPDNSLFPLLNVGSSTAEFRTSAQPFINSEIFAPLEHRGGRVVHTDLKAARGVDIVGDLTDTRFIGLIRATVTPQAVLVSNLFEHVTDREGVAKSVLELVPAGGLIFVSGPHHYPNHPDPIDTGFRPTLTEVHDMFPGTMVVASALIAGEHWNPWAGTSPARYIARLCVPLYRPSSWLRSLVRLSYRWRRVSAYAMVLTKQDANAE